MAVSGSSPPKPTATSALLLLLLSIVAPVRCRPTVQPGLCQNEADDQVQSWPRGIIPYNMSDDLTVAARTELMRSMQMLEDKTCVMFIPRQEQTDYVQFVPGETCCSERGGAGTGQQNVYINDTCPTENTLNTVIEGLIGSQQNCVIGEDNMTVEENGMCIEHIRPQTQGLRGGLIHSPGYPSNYPADSECAWKILVPENHVVNLHFQSFHTERCYDFLEIYQLTNDGSIHNRTELCGNEPDPKSITTHLSASSVVIRFHTDETYSHSGFNITYNYTENVHCDIDNGGCNHTCVTVKESGIGKCACPPGYRLTKRGACLDKNECKEENHGCNQKCANTEGSYYCFCKQGYGLSLDERTCIRCGWTSNRTSGTIKSPGRPGPYPEHQNCIWTIEINPNYFLKLTIQILDIASSEGCTVEYLKFQHGRFPHNRRVCGYQHSISYYVNQNNATSSSLRFRSRDIGRKLESSGFEVNFQQVPQNSVSEEELNTVHIGDRVVEYKSKWFE